MGPTVTGLGAHPARDVPDDEQSERPPAGHVVGRRGEVEQDAAGEAGDEPGPRAVGESGGHHHEQHEVGHDAAPGQLGEHAHLKHDGDDERCGQQHAAHGAEAGVHRRLPSASMTARSLVAPDGTTTPTTSRALKSTKGAISTRCELSRRLDHTVVTRPTGTPGT